MELVFMKNKILLGFLFTVLTFVSVASAGYDTENPLYIENSGDFVSSSDAYIGDHVLCLSQKFSYGINGIISFGADIKYQQDFNGEEDGFSNLGLDLVYRISNARMISDILFGVDFSKASDVDEFSHTIYTTGFRFGRKWSHLTLSGTIKTSWIFNEQNGYAYIDLIPEAYFKFNSMWGAGLGFDFRKSTRTALDRKFLNFKLTQIYGRTQYSQFVKYEFRTDEYTFGGRVNIVF